MKKFAYIFPGQGSQNIEMGKSFYENSSFAKEMFHQAGERLQLDFAKLLFEGKCESASFGECSLEQTQFTQPAILLVSCIAHALFKQENPSLTASYALGHSLGEFSALVSAGAIDLIDAVELVHKRGFYMKEACEKLGSAEAGMMAVLGVKDDSALEDLTISLREKGKKIWCANYNNDGQMVLAGIKTDLESSIDEIKSLGAKRAILLPMSVASHCPLLEDASDKLQGLLQETLKDEFTFPIISNATAKPYKSKEEAIALLTKQLQFPVLYKQSVSSLNGIDGFIEFGHGSVLKGINKKITDIPTENVNSYESLQTIKEFL